MLGPRKAQNIVCRRQIQVYAVKDGSLVVGQFEVAAECRGAWAVHRTISRGKTVPRRWSVSHAPTGKTLVADLKTMRDAWSLVDQLEPMPSGDEKGIPRTTRLAALKTIRSLRAA